jgi:triphosphatase
MAALGDDARALRCHRRTLAPRLYRFPVAPTDDREREWQFDALDLRPVVRWLDERAASASVEPLTIAPAGTVNQVDVYLDTDDRRFHRAGYTLRLRSLAQPGGAGGELTLKALGSTPATDGPRVRREMSEELERPDTTLLGEANGPVGERVRAVAGKRRVEPLFEVRTRRRLYSVGLDGSPQGELALDETSIRLPAGGAPARLRRVELEAPEAATHALLPFVEGLRAACGLQPAGLSKYEAGLLSAGLGAPAAETFGPTTIDPEAAIGAVARAVLRRQFAAMVTREPGTRLGDDIEELHDMRVATRRLRAALSLFSDALPATATKLREELGWVAGALGAVRDLDVQLEQLDEWLTALPDADREPLDALRGLLEEQRASARAEMLAVLDSRRYQTFVDRFTRMLRSGRTPRTGPAAEPARAAAPELIESRFRRFRKAARRIEPHSPPSDYHRLRIRAKRLRYALEFLADLYPANTRPMIKRLVALQDLLGLHQDGDVAIARLRQIVADRGEALPPATVFAMGEIAERYRRYGAELRARFPSVYARVKGKRWKALRREIDEQRPWDGTGARAGSASVTEPAEASPGSPG